jgi:hypothetical protein
MNGSISLLIYIFVYLCRFFLFAEIMSEGLVGSTCNLAGIMAYHCVKYEVILVSFICFIELHLNSFLNIKNLYEKVLQ